MKYGFIPGSSPVAAQVVQVSETGIIIRRAFVQADGNLGSYMEEEEDFSFDWKVYETEAEALAGVSGVGI
jgi:hypothetical protein